MKLSILALCLGLFIGLPALTGIELTKTGPGVPSPVYEHGGGGGP